MWIPLPGWVGGVFTLSIVWSVCTPQTCQKIWPSMSDYCILQNFLSSRLTYYYALCSSETCRKAWRMILWAKTLEYNPSLPPSHVFAERRGGSVFAGCGGRSTPAQATSYSTGKRSIFFPSLAELTAVQQLHQSTNFSVPMKEKY